MYTASSSAFLNLSSWYDMSFLLPSLELGYAEHDAMPGFLHIRNTVCIDPISDGLSTHAIPLCDAFAGQEQASSIIFFSR